jgi:predicted ATPase
VPDTRGLAARARAPYTPRKEEPHGRQDTEATAEAEEAEDADGRNPLNPARGDVGRGRSVGRVAGSAQLPAALGQALAAPVLPGA